VREERDIVYAGLGPLAALILGMALVPFREVTSASNLTFVFLALIIVVAEWGGRAAALVTAVVAALSLNFFLTKPYLRLTIHGRDDIIAFVGLAACGLLAAALGSSRSRRARELESTRGHLELLHASLGQLEAAGPVEPSLGRMLNALRKTLPVAAAVVRDEHNHVLAASDQAAGRPVPHGALTAADLPADGARLPLVAANRQVGWLDVWGDGSGAEADSRNVLADVGRLIAVRIAAASLPPARA
jgi:K+-sensing histidine kinase KdpD